MEQREWERLEGRYNAWLAKVDEVLLRLVGLTHEDLADGPSWDAWENGDTPAEFAHAVLGEEF